MKLRHFQPILALISGIFLASCSSSETAAPKAATSAANVAPAITSSSPASPNRSLTPKIIGTATAGSTVKVFSNSTCTGSPVNSSTASVFSSPGIPVTVSANTSTLFYVQSVTSGGVTSICSPGGLTYTNDNTAPALTETSVVTTPFASNIQVTYGGACENNIPIYLSGAVTATVTCTAGAWTYTTTGASEAQRTYTFTQTDSASNSTSVTRIFTLQTTSPTLTSMTLNGGTSIIQSTTVPVTLSASATAASMCVVEAADCTGCTFADAFSASTTVPITSSTGSHTIQSQVKDLAGNLSACISGTINHEQLTVSPKYSFAPNWNDWYRDAVTPTQACDGSESGYTSCKHGGVLRKVITTETSCAPLGVPLTMADTLTAFTWVCAIENGVAVFSGTLKGGKSIVDLLNVGGTAFRNNSVTLTGGGGGTSYSQAWWTNTVTSLPNNSATAQETLSGTGTIYTLAANQDTRGYVIGSNNISIISLVPATYKLSWKDGAALNCNDTAPFSASSPNKKCIFLSSGKSFFSINLLLDTSAAVSKADYGVLASNLTHSKFSSVYTASPGDSSNYSGFQSAGLYLKYATSSDIESIRTSANTGYGFRFDNVSLSNLATLKADNTTGVGMALTSSTTNTLSDLIVDNSSGDGLQLKSGTSSNTFTRTAISGSTAGYTLSLTSSSNSNTFSTLSAINPALSGIYISSSKQNTFYDFKAANAGSNAIELTSSKDNVFSKGLIGSSTNGISLATASTFNIFSRITATNLNGSGITLNASSGNIFYQFLIANSTTGLALAASSDSNTFAQISIFDSTTIATLNASSSSKFTGGLVYGNVIATCTITDGTHPGLASDCSATDSSNHLLVNKWATIASSWIEDSGEFGRVQTTDATNNGYIVSNSSGASVTPYSLTSIDWFRFANSFRIWGIQGTGSYPLNNQRGACKSGTCQIWDFSLGSADAVLLGRSGNGTAMNDAWGATCPSQTYGTEYLESQTFVRDSDNSSLTSGAIYVSGPSGGGSGCHVGDTCKFQFLKNATEDPTSTGNLNGLCETNDTCVYTPNFGFYQGSGVQTGCTWTAGVVNGVTLQGLPTNGE